MNVTLIGMAGAGKSYIGKQLAQKIGLEFVDIDDILEVEHEKSLQKILEEVGEQGYLELEARMLIERTQGRDNMLISPGGSIIYRDDAMDHVKAISTVIYLKVPYKTIEERKRDAPPRAVIGLGHKTLRELYEERVPLYEMKADLTVETESKTAEEVVDVITSKLFQS